MNLASSRSHAIFTISVETERVIGGKTFHSKGKLNLVDLAGSGFKNTFSLIFRLLIKIFSVIYAVDVTIFGFSLF